VKVRIDGRTDHHHNVRPHAKVDFRQPPRFDGWFTTKRTRQRAVCVGKVHGNLANGQRVYLITLTHGKWAPDVRSPMQPRPEFTGYRRRKALRLFLDNLRKVDGYAGHLWTTERHKSGALHHHVVVRFTSSWLWRRVVVKWSNKYCGSPNGLDVVEVSKGDGNKVNAYVAKVLGYCSKGLGKEAGVPFADDVLGVPVLNYADAVTGEVTDGGWDALPFRWWGTSKVVRHWEEEMSEAPPFVPSDSVKGRMVTGRVPDHYAISAASMHTRRVEQLRLKNWLLLRALAKERKELRQAQRANRLWWITRRKVLTNSDHRLQHNLNGP